MLRRLHPAADERLLVGFSTGDDAAVWRLDERTALVFTTDFFTPVVDDPYDWGRIAAANATSDVYAMGGRPVLALNIAGWPRDTLPLDMLGRVLEGGAAVAAEAGMLVAGGHTIDDPEPKYGMAVVGLVDPARVVRNDAAADGDVLVLTKPLGTGILSTAIKRGDATAEQVAAVVATMAALNRDASEEMLAADVRAATDVTGFGLLGHLQRLLAASGVSATLDPDAVPRLDGVDAFATAGVVPGGTRRNLAHVEPHVDWADASETERIVLADAQTSGGLLLCVAGERVAGLEAALRARGVRAVPIGRVEEGEAGTIRLRRSFRIAPA